MRRTACFAVAVLTSGCLKPRNCLELYTCPPNGIELSETVDGGADESSHSSLLEVGTHASDDSALIDDAAMTSHATLSDSLGLSGATEDGGRGILTACGNGAFDEGESCDDGNIEDETSCAYGQATCVACSAGCSEILELTGPTCGDGAITNGEACDIDVQWCNECRVRPQLIAGGAHTCALLATGAVSCWGWGANGELGNGLTQLQTTPVGVLHSDVVAAIAVGSGHSWAILADGTVNSWGSGSFGTLGNGATNDETTPTSVSELSGAVSKISAGAIHSCALLKDEGVQCWGLNRSGQLGDGSFDDKNSPTERVNLGGTALAVAAGGYHTCALLHDGTVKCWGLGSKGQLGNDATENQPNPVTVVGLDQAATDIAVGSYHSCALLSNGAVKCWGAGANGQLGNGLAEDQAIPVEVVALGGTAKNISAGPGGNHTCALLNDGSMRCWGAGDRGQLGYGDTDDQLEPIQVAGVTEQVAALSAGGSHTCALLTDSSAKCWGAGDRGQLGNGRTDDQLTPVSVIGIP